MSEPTAGQLKRSISLAGAIALVVGAVIGAGIYVLVTDIASATGPAIWIAFSAAMLISLISVLPLIQLAGALPRAGGGYFFTSRMLSPGLGFVTSWWIVLAGAASTCLVAITLAYNIEPYLPEWLHLTPRWWAMIIVISFYLIYLVGVDLAIWLQILMAAQFVTALLAYAIVGAFSVDIDVAAASPRGMGGLVMGTLICYSTCMGFQVIAELGEEIHDARRNIPLALLIGGGIVAVIYITVSQVFVSAIPFDPVIYESLRVPLMTSAESFLPAWFLPYLSLGAFTAGLTSLNAAAIALPREIFAQARDGVLSPFFAKVTPHTHVPQRAVSFFFLFVVVLLALAPWLAPRDEYGVSQETDFFSIMAGVGILVMSGMICVACLRLPKKYPERYENSYIKFPMPLLWVCTVITVVVSLGFAVLLLTEVREVVYVYAGWSVLMWILYRLSTRNFTAADWARATTVTGDDDE